jgi:hypothetical protein
LYDRHGDKIGSLYPRRAKQLLLKGRADWLEEGRSLQLVANIRDSSETHEFKEENEMTDEHVYTNNGKPIPAAALPAEAADIDGVLLFQARLNIKDKQNLIYHVIAILITILLLGLTHSIRYVDVTHTYHNYPQHPDTWIITDSLRNHSPATFRFFVAHEIDMLVSEALYEISQGSHQIHPAWYAAWGAIIFWGCWIFIRVIKRLAYGARVSRVGSIRRVRPDPVMEEYNRLKRMT